MAELREISANLSTGYWDRPFNDEHLYGYSEHVNLLPDDPGSWIIHASSAIALGIKARCSSAILVFLDFADDETLQERIRARYVADSDEAVERRLRHATHERSAKNRYDHIIASNSPEQITRELLEKIRARSSAVSQKISSLPGPLADIDIHASLEAPNGLRIHGVPLDVLATRIHGWSVDLTLAPRFYRVVRPIFSRRVFDLARGGSSDMLSRFRECIAPDGGGIYLKPHEFILASTVETLRVPSHMVCLVSGRSSYARMGVSVELSQIVVQPGHEDVIPLQIKNNMPYPIVVYPNISVAQAVFFNTISRSGSPYTASARAKYPRHADDVRSRYYLDPAYALLRASTPTEAPFDWNHLLNILLFMGESEAKIDKKMAARAA